MPDGLLLEELDELLLEELDELLDWLLDWELELDDDELCDGLEELDEDELELVLGLEEGIELLELEELLVDSQALITNASPNTRPGASNFLVDSFLI